MVWKAGLEPATTCLWNKHSNHWIISTWILIIYEKINLHNVLLQKSHLKLLHQKLLHLNYTILLLYINLSIKWCSAKDLNLQPDDYKSAALPFVLTEHLVLMTRFELARLLSHCPLKAACLPISPHEHIGAWEKIWTFDPLVNSQML